MKHQPPPLTSLAAAGLLALSPQAQGQFSGDFSGDNDNPTFLGTFTDDFTIEDAFVVGAGGPNADVDVFSFTIAEGFQIEGITLTEFISTDNVGFIAIAAGASFPFSSSELTDSDLFLAADLFGTSGTDGSAPIVPDLLNEFVNNSVAGAGLTAPIDAGTFTVFAQQLGGTGINFGLAFDVEPVPEPTTAGLTGAAGLLALRRRRRA